MKTNPAVRDLLHPDDELIGLVTLAADVADEALENLAVAVLTEDTGTTEALALGFALGQTTAGHQVVAVEIDSDCSTYYLSGTSIASIKRKVQRLLDAAREAA